MSHGHKTFRRRFAHDDLSINVDGDPVHTRSAVMGRCEPDECDCKERTRSYLAGSRDACDPMIENLKPLVWGIVRRILSSGRPEDHEEAVQDVLLTVFGRLGTWKGQCPFCNWVAIVATRRAISLKRAQSRKPTVPLPPGEIADPRAADSSRDLGNCPEKVLANVPSEWRYVFDLTYKDGKSREEVARIVGKSPRAIKYWLAEMLDQIRRCVKKL
jgi:RNA polymerase sigma-70 factor, ECF subfamily